MAKKEQKTSYKDINVDELRTKLDKTRQELFKVRFRAAAAPVTNTMQIRQLRREVARLNTFITQKADQKAPVAVVATSKNGRKK